MINAVGSKIKWDYKYENQACAKKETGEDKIGIQSNAMLRSAMLCNAFLCVMTLTCLCAIVCPSALHFFFCSFISPEV